MGVSIQIPAAVAGAPATVRGGGVGQLEADVAAGETLAELRGEQADEVHLVDVGDPRRFDREAGAPRGSLATAGATFLNDVTPFPKP